MVLTHLYSRRKTLDFITTISGAGADFITVHGRRRSQRSSEPVDLDAIKSIKQSATVSVVANGDAFSLADVKRIAEYTGVDGMSAPFSPLTWAVRCVYKAMYVRGLDTDLGGVGKGVMAARPLLSNPALFAGYDSTPWEAVEKFMACAVEAPIPFPLVQHHLAEMTKGVLGRGERRGMLDAGREGMLGLVDWFEGRGLG